MCQIPVSIIVPCYKVEQYLPKCLDSLTSQTLDGIEIICINDGSPDACIEILHDYQSRFPENIVIIDKKNEGVWRGRFDAISIARGEYIGFVDSDDYVEKNFAEKLYQTATRNNADISVCGFKRIDAETGKTLTTEMASARNPFDAQHEPQRLLELNGAPWNKFFKASLLKNLYDFKTPPRIFDDMMLHLLTYPKVRTVAFCSDALVNYIIRNDSIMTTIDKSKIESAYNAMREVKAFYSSFASQQLNYFVDAAAFLHLGLSLMFRISYDTSAHLPIELKRNREYLDAVFPTWKNGAILSLSNALKYGSAIRKTYLARLVYKAKLMLPALALYRTLIHKLGIDIKW